MHQKKGHHGTNQIKIEGGTALPFTFSNAKALKTNYSECPGVILDI